MYNKSGAILRWLLKIFTGGIIVAKPDEDGEIKITIVGAGSLGVNLAEELTINTNSPYMPCYFVDNKPEKIGRIIHYLEVLEEFNKKDIKELRQAGVQNVVIAITNLDVNGSIMLYLV